MSGGNKRGWKADKNLQCYFITNNKVKNSSGVHTDYSSYITLNERRMKNERDK